MSCEPMDPRTLRRLVPLQVTCPSVDPDVPPRGYRPFEVSAPLLRRDFPAAADDLLAWGLQLRSGMQVLASHPSAVVGALVDLRIQMGPLGIHAPCRVLAVIQEEDRRGFVYGTLPGHPESGVERFEVLRRADGELSTRVSGFSRPGRLLTRIGFPVTAAVQRHYTRGYMTALDRR